MFSATDVTLLTRAVSLAEAYVGFTTPNPPVGAICAREGRILGEGAHQKAGTPHAEVHALQSCTEDPAGATLYVTLEPCCTTGRTPPCCDLIRAKRLGRVVIGCLDPNPKHAGRGVAILQEAGIEVVIAQGAIAETCRLLVAPFVKAITTGLPYVRVKLALTLDGYVADAQRTSKWITGDEARAWVQQLRSKVDAIMVGAGTVRADHPSLQPHLPEVLPKWRVLVDRTHPIAEEDIDEHTLVARRDLGYNGSDVVQLLRALCARGINDVLCEGGGILAGALLDAGVVDELNLFYAPKFLGDPQAMRGWVTLPRLLAQAMQFTVVRRLAFGDDTLLQLRPKRSCSESSYV